jgi:hypothetical protein
MRKKHKICAADGVNAAGVIAQSLVSPLPIATFPPSLRFAGGAMCGISFLITPHLLGMLHLVVALESL